MSESGPKLRAWDPSVTGMACAQLREARARAQDALHALRAAPDLLVPAAQGIDVATLRLCGAAIRERAVEARRLVEDLDGLHDHTALAGRAYAWASDAVRHLIEQTAGGVAHALGSAARGALLAVAPGAVAIGLVAVPLAARLLLLHPELLASVTQRAGRVGTDVARFLDDTSGFWERAGELLMANPVFTTALALAVESTDEALAGLLGIPAPMAAQLESRVGDDEVLGMIALAAAGGAGLVTGGGRVQAVFRRPVAVPDAPIADPAAAMRIIVEQDDQVTIHEHRMPDGARRFQVFVRGTESIGPDPSTGLDMRANLENAGDDGARLHGSSAAVAAAMRQAGVQPGDAVDLFGFSQGAGAVASVAASGEFDVQTALLVGGPVDAAGIPPQVAVFSVAHHGDVVPSLDGWGDERVHATTVVESAGGHGSGPLARHSGLEYIETLDALDDLAYDRYRERLATLAAGGIGIAGVSVHLRRR
ncbi:hypothetical protein AA0Z99_11480 [Agrococcus sp. 1P02AA]|uniref:hypothetical protein n=1 Tax=Agrococcus sp. 1P02AA TaxID=3132259 RepID=UPI0039A40D32